MFLTNACFAVESVFVDNMEIRLLTAGVFFLVNVVLVSLVWPYSIKTMNVLAVVAGLLKIAEIAVFVFISTGSFEHVCDVMVHDIMFRFLRLPRPLSRVSLYWALCSDCCIGVGTKRHWPHSRCVPMQPDDFITAWSSAYQTVQIIKVMLLVNLSVTCCKML